MVQSREPLLITAHMLAIINLPLVISYGTEYVTCDNDAQCSSTEFCYVSGLCVPCLNCTTYHREQPSFLDCIEDAKQCGGCFDGWKDEIFTNGERRESCIKIRIDFNQTMVAEQNTTDSMLRYAHLGQFVLMAITAAVFFIKGLLWCRIKWAKPSRVPLSHNLLPAEQAIAAAAQSPQSPDISFLYDEDTIPSSWSPNNESTSSTGTKTCNSTTVDQDFGSGTDDSNEPPSKRIRVRNSESESRIDVFREVSKQESLTNKTGINLYITNKFVIS